ncbi:MAG TPA: DUF2520 domain-containing protein [Bacteroidetes bacterium]|nr:DUF2520 domain-containing protein [Bacteroidota bacterium]
MKIVIIGAGRLGLALGKELIKRGHSILKLISRSGEKAAVLASVLGCAYGNELIIPGDAEVVIVAINDDSLESVLKKLKVKGNPIIAHTAGSVGLEVFGERISGHGVFYPLQTFTRGREYDFTSIPVFIEASDDQTEKVLRSLAYSLSEKVFTLNSEKRKYLHLAAVFSCNFVNHMYYSGKEITARAGMDFGVLLPLMRETMEKAADMGPEKSQTGPAVRNDKNTIEKHLDLLSFSPDLQKIYRVITDSIINKYTG